MPRGSAGSKGGSFEGADMGVCLRRLARRCVTNLAALVNARRRRYGSVCRASRSDRSRGLGGPAACRDRRLRRHLAGVPAGASADICAGASDVSAVLGGSCGAAHSMTFGSRSAASAPSSSSPALTSSVTCSPWTKACRAASRSASPDGAAELVRHLIGLAQRVGRGVAVRPTPGRRRPTPSPGAYAAFMTLPSSAMPMPAPSWYEVSPIAAAPPACSGGCLAEHRLVRAEERGLQAETEQHEADGEQQRPVVLSHQRQQQHGGGGQDETPADHPAGTEAAQGVRAGGTGRHGGEGERQQPQSGLQRAQPEDQLEVLDGDQFQADQRQHREHDAADRGGEGGPGEHPHVYQRMFAALLAAYEEGESSGSGEQRDRPYGGRGDRRPRRAASRRGRRRAHRRRPSARPGRPRVRRRRPWTRAAATGRPAGSAAISGMLIRKTEPHQKCWTRKPPRTGPVAAPTAATAVHMPMAVARSRRSGKTALSMESVAGMIIAPPTPSRARAAMSTSGVVASAATAEATPKRA